MPENIGYQFNRLYASPIETYRQVNTITQRNAIPPEIRWEGMECYVITENQDYQLVGGVDNSNWVNAGETPLNPITHFKGFFNATTLTPPIDNTNGIEGDEYKVTDADSGVEVDFGAGDVLVKTGDILIFYQSEWMVKVVVGSGGGGDVSSVFGRIGDVVAQNSDYSSYYSPIITGGASTIVSGDLTASRALVSSSGGKVAVSDITSTELGYLDNATSNIQTQLNAKLATSSYTAADVLTKIKTVDGSGSGLDADLLRGVHWGNVNTPLSSSSTSKFTFNLIESPGGSAVTEFLITGVSRWRVGSDFSDSSRFIIGRGTNWSTGKDIAIDFSTGNVGIGNTNNTYKLDVSGTGRFTGTAIAAPATLSTELVTKGQLDAATRPYKVYTALLAQSGTNNPVATVMENNLGGSITWTRSSEGVYLGTLSIAGFTNNKTLPILNLNNASGGMDSQFKVNSTTVVQINTTNGGVFSDSILTTWSFVEIRVYN